MLIDNLNGKMVGPQYGELEPYSMYEKNIEEGHRYKIQLYLLDIYLCTIEYDWLLECIVL